MCCSSSPTEWRSWTPTLQLYAFERDKRRFSTLKMMLTKAGCKNVEALNADFLAVDPSDPIYGQATHMLVDPLTFKRRAALI